MTEDGALGFTATRDLIAPWKIVIDECLRTPGNQARRYVTGGARGGDAYVGRRLAELYPFARHQVIVPWDRSQVDPWWLEPEFARHVEVFEMPEGSTFKDRNQALVDAAERILGLPAYQENDGRSQRSGTWQTIRLARKAGTPVNWVILADEAN